MQKQHLILSVRTVLMSERRTMNSCRGQVRLYYRSQTVMVDLGPRVVHEIFVSVGGLRNAPLAHIGEVRKSRFRSYLHRALVGLHAVPS
jgi:hypothetical protein